jgi:hypothetical protein
MTTPSQHDVSFPVVDRRKESLMKSISHRKLALAAVVVAAVSSTVKPLSMAFASAALSGSSRWNATVAASRPLPSDVGMRYCGDTSGNDLFKREASGGNCELLARW